MADLNFISFCWICMSMVMLVLIYRYRKGKTNFYLRVRSWWWMLGILTLVTFLGYIGFLLLIVFFSAYGTLELLRQTNISFWYRNVLILILPFSSVMTLFQPYLAFIFIGISMPILILSMQCDNRAKIITVCLYLILFTSISSMLQLLFSIPGKTQGSWLLYLFFVTQMCDVSQYFWGKFCGRKPLLLKVSPNKTIEGAVGGVFTSGLLSTIVGFYLLDYDFIHILIISLVISIFGVLGDLYVSLYKRIVGIKDMGELIPGHGGLLDRIDSLLISSPLLLLILF